MVETMYYFLSHRLENPFPGDLPQTSPPLRDLPPLLLVPSNTFLPRGKEFCGMKQREPGLTTRTSDPQLEGRQEQQSGRCEGEKPGMGECRCRAPTRATVTDPEGSPRAGNTHALRQYTCTDAGLRGCVGNLLSCSSQGPQSGLQSSSSL